MNFKSALSLAVLSLLAFKGQAVKLATEDCEEESPASGGNNVDISITFDVTFQKGAADGEGDDADGNGDGDDNGDEDGDGDDDGDSELRGDAAGVVTTTDIELSDDLLVGTLTWAEWRTDGALDEGFTETEAFTSLSFRQQAYLDALIDAQNEQGDSESLSSSSTVTIEWRAAEGFDFEVVELSDDTEVGELTWGTLKSTGALDADFKSESYYSDLNGR